MNINNVVCYARVSTLSQDLDLQMNEIKRFCDYRNYTIIRFFSDKASGKDMDRVDFQDMMELLDKRNTLGIQAVVIHKIDRIGRNLSDLIRIVEFLKSKNIQLISISDNIDTTTDQGTLFFHLIGAISEYERKLIVERTNAGRKEAIANGIKFGRPKKVISKENWDRILVDIGLGVPKSKICRKFGMKRSTFYKKLNEKREAEQRLR